MREQVKIPCVMMRGGTSRGPFFLRSDLPSDVAKRDALLVSLMGSGHALQIDGIGGGHALTSKVAIISPSQHPGADVDYLFAQVHVLKGVVDTSPNCGNMLSAVGPFAIDAGLIRATAESTRVRIYNVNTGKIIEATVPTHNGQAVYDGDTEICGVPGTAAPILLKFVDSAGSKTGALLPTGNVVDTFEGVEVSCVDAAMPVVLMRASDLGKTGHESPAELNADKQFLARLEAIRIAAGTAMKITDVADRVIPKPILLAPGRERTNLTTRYFMPHDCHTALAITGAVALATACCTPGTIAATMCGPFTLPKTLSFGHATGWLDAVVEKSADASAPTVSLVRTARRLFDGYVYASVETSALEAAA